jgi:hypothetical protein
MEEKMALRGYEAEEYEIAIQAAVEMGWAEQADRPGAFRLTVQGKQLRAQTEQLTNQYFFAPWSVLVPAELDELFKLLTKLHHELKIYRQTRTGH